MHVRKNDAESEYKKIINDKEVCFSRDFHFIVPSFL